MGVTGRQKALVVSILIVAVLSVVLYYFFFQPEFEISANPETVTLYSFRGSSNNTVITLNSIRGLSGAITFEVAPGFGVGEVRLAQDPPEVYLPADGEAQSVLTLEVLFFIAPGEYYVEVIGVAATLKRSVLITVIVI